MNREKREQGKRQEKERKKNAVEQNKIRQHYEAVLNQRFPRVGTEGLSFEGLAGVRRTG